MLAELLFVLLVVLLLLVLFVALLLLVLFVLLVLFDLFVVAVVPLPLLGAFFRVTAGEALRVLVIGTSAGGPPTGAEGFRASVPPPAFFIVPFRLQFTMQLQLYH